MGEIQKQSIKGTLFTYSGALLGFVISGLIYPRFLEKEQIGVINVLVAYAMIFAQVFGLGFMNTTTKFFPYFRDYKKKHNGFLFLGILVSLIGSILALIAYFLLRDSMLESQAGDFKDFNQYIDLMIPIFISIILFNFFDNYYKVLYNAYSGIWLKEVILRVLTISGVVFLIYNYIDFKSFSTLYAFFYVLILVILVFKIIRSGHFSLKPSIALLNKDRIREMASVSFFGIISSASGLVLVTVDRIMVKDLIGFNAAGLYATCFYFGALVGMPTRAIIKTASTYIADAWKNNDQNLLRDVYQKSSQIQFLFGLFLLIGLLINLDNIDALLKYRFTDGLIIIPIVGLAFLTDMLSGTSGSIINNSRYYRYNAYMMLGFVIIIIAGNYFLIPRWGILGAALASLFSKAVYNLIKFLFVYKRFKLQPYNLKYLWILFAGAVSLIPGILLPGFGNYIVDIVLRSGIVSFLYIGLNYLFKSSDELNNLLKKYVPFLK